MTKKALILGIGGQDASYLAEHLLSLDYEVWGMYRRSSVDNLARVKHLEEKIVTVCGDLLDVGSLCNAIGQSQPEEIYNMADQDNVNYSFDVPGYNADVTYRGVVNLFSALGLAQSGVRIYQPVSATMFSGTVSRQCEDTPVDPQSPYAVAKTAAYHYCRLMRKNGFWVSTGICYNHDSPRRGPGYLLQKIARGVAKVVRTVDSIHFDGYVSKIQLWNPHDSVEVGFAGDYAKAAHAILQYNRPDDFLLATGKPYTIESIVNIAFYTAGVKHKADWEPYVEWFDGPRTPRLVGRPDKAVGAGVWDCRHDALSVVEMLVKHHLGQ